MSDGPLPDDKAGEVANRLDDLRRDLGDVVAGNADGKQNFTDDLLVFVDVAEKPDAAPAIRQLAGQVADAVAAAKLAEPALPPLLRHLWVAVSARQLSERQVTTLQNDVRTTLNGLGIPEATAQAITNQVGTVQKAVTDRSRRWYEVF